MMEDIEIYEITLKHYPWKYDLIGDPLILRGAFDERFTPSSKFLGNMFEKLKEAVLEKEKTKDEFLN